MVPSEFPAVHSPGGEERVRGGRGAWRTAPLTRVQGCQHSGPGPFPGRPRSAAQAPPSLHSPWGAQSPESPMPASPLPSRWVIVIHRSVPVSFLTSGHSTSCVCVLHDVGCLGCTRYWGLRVRLWVPQFFLLSLPCHLPYLWCSTSPPPGCTWPGGPTGSLWDCLQGVPAFPPLRDHAGQVSLPVYSALPSSPLSPSYPVCFRVRGPLVLPLSLSPGCVSGGEVRSSVRMSMEVRGQGRARVGRPRRDEGEGQGGGALGQLPTVLPAPPHASLPGLAASAVALSSLIW